MDVGSTTYFVFDAFQQRDQLRNPPNGVPDSDTGPVLCSNHRLRRWALDAPAQSSEIRHLSLLEKILGPTLGICAPEQASLLLARFGSIAGIMNASSDALLAALPTSSAAVEAVLAARDLSLIGWREGLKGKKVEVDDPNFRALLVSELQNPTEERLHAVFLDMEGHFIRDERVGSGGRSFLALRMRPLMHRALELGASMMILAHNHPSGRPFASKEDQEATANLEWIARTLDVALVDHCIVAQGKVYSMRRGEVL